jgi:hypothetical protein
MGTPARPPVLALHLGTEEYSGRSRRACAGLTGRTKNPGVRWDTGVLK